MIYNTFENTFGGKLRKGDLVGVLNIVEHYRIQHNDPTIQFYVSHNNIACEPEFLDWLQTNTNYLSKDAGHHDLPFDGLNIWAYRIPPSNHNIPNIINAGEFLHIPNPQPMQQKICVFPIFDAPYHLFRMWSVDMLNSILAKFDAPEYQNFDKVLCMKDVVAGIHLQGFRISTSLTENIEHIMTCSHYVGGETGLTILASVLDKPARTLLYYYAANTHQNPPYYNSYPFYLQDGQLIKY